MRRFASKRLQIILAIGLVGVLAAVFYVRYFIVRPVGRGPAGPTVSNVDFDRTWTERRVQFVGIGDSVTAGLGAAGKDHSYFNRLIANPFDEFPEMEGICLSAVIPNLEWENLAVSGSTSDQHLATINNRLVMHNADVFGMVVMTTGGNDLIHSYGRMPPREYAMYGATMEQAKPWIAAFGERLNAMLDGIESKFPGGCEIYLANIYDPTDGVGDAPSIFLPPWPDGLAIHAETNRIIERCTATRDNVHLVDLYTAFMGHGSHCRQFWRSTYDSNDPHYWYHENVEDPNDRGYDAIRRVFMNSILRNSAMINPEK